MKRLCVYSCLILILICSNGVCKQIDEGILKIKEDKFKKAGRALSSRQELCIDDELNAFYQHPNGRIEQIGHITSKEELPVLVELIDDFTSSYYLLAEASFLAYYKSNTYKKKDYQTILRGIGFSKKNSKLHASHIRKRAKSKYTKGGLLISATVFAILGTYDYLTGEDDLPIAEPSMSYDEKELRSYLRIRNDCY